MARPGGPQGTGHGACAAGQGLEPEPSHLALLPAGRARVSRRQASRLLPRVQPQRGPRTEDLSPWAGQLSSSALAVATLTKRGAGSAAQVSGAFYNGRGGFCVRTGRAETRVLLARQDVGGVAREGTRGSPSLPTPHGLVQATQGIHSTARREFSWPPPLEMEGFPGLEGEAPLVPRRLGVHHQGLAGGSKDRQKALGAGGQEKPHLVQEAVASAESQALCWTALMDSRDKAVPATWVEMVH